MYLLKNCSDLRSIFVKHFIRKSFSTLMYSTLVAASLQFIFACFMFYSSGITQHPLQVGSIFVFGPIISLMLVYSQASPLRIVLCLLLAYIQKPIPIFHIQYDKNSLYFVGYATAFIFCTHQTQKSSPATYQIRSRRSAFRVAMNALPLIYIPLCLFVLKNNQILQILYIKILTQFTESFLHQMLSETIPELQNAQTLSACCLNLSVYLGARLNDNIAYLKSFFNKDPSGQLQYGSKIDSFVLFHIIAAVQRSVLLQSSIQIPDLQKAARALQPIGHIHTSSETLTSELAFLDFLFYVIFELSARLFRSQPQLDSLQKLMQTFSSIYEPQLIQQLQIQTGEEIQYNEVANEFGLNLNQDGTDFEATEQNVNNFEAKNFSNLKISNFTVLKAFILRQITINDLLQNNFREKMNNFEEQRLRMKETKAKKRSQMIINFITVRWARDLLTQICSQQEDTSVLRRTIGVFTDIMIKMKDKNIYNIKITTNELWQFINNCAAEKRTPEINMAVLVAKGCLE
ncbi:Transmembrane_domain-containing protein [Hexamita inflata]|uniref:Transmembrane domain-containing protein n=1 Tax=Hexamita inflata TaxID=28002 RepID=A0AA86PUX1_9EUKA|nr:Transmembrane domain-containing protein [Hexamita inflata]CAI9976885.1 Transmembrane domain-containing protein [Hexamita inflata]